MPLSSSFYQPLFQAPKQPSNMIDTFMVLYGAKNPLFANLSVDEPSQPRFHSLQNLSPLMKQFIFSIALKFHDGKFALNKLSSETNGISNPSLARHDIATVSS
jgi:hypothetical protein